MSEELIAKLNKALEIKPDDHQAWYKRGIALDDLGRYEEAIYCYDKALQFKPDNASAYYNKACTYALQNNVSPAVENLKRAIILDEKYREIAKNESDFDKIRDHEQFTVIDCEQ